MWRNNSKFNKINWAQKRKIYNKYKEAEKIAKEAKETKEVKKVEQNIQEKPSRRIKMADKDSDEAYLKRKIVFLNTIYC